MINPRDYETVRQIVNEAEALQRPLVVLCVIPVLDVPEDDAQALMIHPATHSVFETKGMIAEALEVYNGTNGDD